MFEVTNGDARHTIGWICEDEKPWAWEYIFAAEWIIRSSSELKTEEEKN